MYVGPSALTRPYGPNAAGQAWQDSLLRQYASWGVDLLKVDCIADHPYKVDEIRMSYPGRWPGLVYDRAFGAKQKQAVA